MMSADKMSNLFRLQDRAEVYIQLSGAWLLYFELNFKNKNWVQKLKKILKNNNVEFVKCK